MKELLSQRISNIFRKPEGRKPSEIQLYLESFPHLREEDIRAILNVVRRNIEQTTAYGYTIPPETVQKEELFCLAFLNKWGGIEGVAELGWDRAFSLLHETSAISFAQEFEAAFHQFSDDQESIKTWYAAHWTCLQSDLLRLCIS